MIHFELAQEPQHQLKHVWVKVQKDGPVPAAKQQLLILPAEHLIQSTARDLQEGRPCGHHSVSTNIQLQDVITSRAGNMGLGSVGGTLL